MTLSFFNLKMFPFINSFTLLSELFFSSYAWLMILGALL